MSIIGAFNVGRPEAWMAKAVCKDCDPELFYLSPGDDSGYAKRVCAKCPVRQKCLEFALKHNEIFGIWGGLSPRERQRIRRSLRDARPGYCPQDHDLTIHGVGADGRCKQCHRDRWARYEERRRCGLAAPRKRDRERRGGAA